LRSKHSPSLAYAGSFIIHYVEKIVYIEISRFVVLVFTILLCGLNAWLYLRKRKQGVPHPPLSPVGRGKGEGAI
jgi:hypothetical protein